MKKIIIYKMTTGDEVHLFDHNIIIPFKGPRKVLSTEAFNGGFRKNIKCVGNHDGRFSPGVSCKMKGDTVKEHQKKCIEEKGLEAEETVLMGTAALMENAAIVEESYGELSVTAVVTAGIYVNGGRVGDPVVNIEDKLTQKTNPDLGTINIILYIDADLPENVMTRALVTCTEAKTAALQELLAPSRYSRGIATGSGTDGTIIVSNSESELNLTDAGKHSKLGELIGISVKKAVKKSLELQRPLCAKYQYNAAIRLERFGVNDDFVYKSYLARKHQNIMNRPDFSAIYEKVIVSPKMIVLSSLLAHLIDQMDWDLISNSDAQENSQILINSYADKYSIHPDYLVEYFKDKDLMVESIVNTWINFVIDIVLEL